MFIKTDKSENIFDTIKLSKVFSLSVFLFVLMIIPARANDWCQVSSNEIEPCINNTPKGWVECGSFNGKSVWCDPSISDKSNRDDVKLNDKTKNPHRFYAGLSVGYVAFMNGGMTADYKNKTDSWVVPGSFRQSEFEINKRSTPIQFSVGANIINDLRVDISHMFYSGISLPGLVSTSAGGRDGGYTDYFSFHSRGGDISGSATMVNAYYNLDHFTGRIIGGKLSPYIGAGIGLGTNKISDYVIYEEGHHAIDAGMTGSSNILVVHSGGTTNNFAYSFEVGGTSQLFNRLQLDLFVRYTDLGRVQTNGDVLLTQTVWVDGAPDHNETLNYKNWRESGTLSIVDIGARLRFLF